MDSPSSPVPLDTLLAHRAWVRGLARTLVAGESAVDEVEQRTWVAAVQRPPHDAGTVRAWLGTVVRNVVRESARVEGRRRRHESAAARPERVAATDEVVAQAETHRAVVLAVMDLDEPYRTTVLLRFFEGLPPRDVAARMDVPVETVRTRLRRALERLRERLEREHGGGDRCRAALAALSASRGFDEEGDESLDDEGHGAPSRRAGGRSMSMPWIVAATVIGAAGVAVLVAAGDGAGVPPVAPPDARDVAGAADETGGAGSRPRERERAEPSMAAAEDVPPAGGRAIPVTGGEAEAPPLPESVPTGGDLHLSLRVAPEVPAADQTITLLATFRNAGPGPVTFFTPEHRGHIAFPAWRLRGETGDVWTPSATSFQSMWHGGIQGELVTLKPGEEWVAQTEARGFAPVSPVEDRWASVQLPPGRYVVSCTYAHAAATVPWSPRAFDVERRELSGLWSGTVRADDRAIQVRPAGSPTLVIEAPEPIAAGGACPVEVRLQNGSGGNRTFRGALRFAVHRKGMGEAVTAPAPWRPEGREVAEDGSFTLAAGETLVRTVDVAALEFTRSGVREGPAGGLAEAAGGSLLLLTATFETGDEATALHSNLLWRTLAAPPDAAPRGLRLRAEVVVEGEDRVVEAFAHAVLRNEGADTLRVPSRLEFPRQLAVQVHRADPRTGEFAPDPLPIDGRALDRDSKAASADEFVLLAPGEQMRGTIDLALLLAEPLTAGRYELRVGWHNVDSGRHMGFAQDDVLVGRASAPPVTFEVP